MNNKLNRLLNPGLGLYFWVMLGFALAALLLNQYLLAAAEGIVVLLLFISYRILRKTRRRQLLRYIQSLPDSLESVSHGENPFPTVIVRLGDGGIIWVNESFVNITGLDDSMVEYALSDVLPDFKLNWLTDRKSEAPHDVTIGSHRYRVYGTSIRAEDTGIMLGVLYFTDLTNLYQIRDEYVRSRPVVSIILVDNYEELTKNLSESAIAALNAKLGDTITQWTDNYRGLLRRLERNRFLFIFEKQDLTRAIEDKFSLLENIHQITSPSGLAASISMGLGIDAENFEESFNFAALGIEMALSRGGDQAVIKDRFNFSFYGGRSTETDYSSKVRSRVTANSLMELIGQAGHVYIMGHKNADLDALGAAIGINCLCRKKGKKANIVIDLEHNAAKRLIDEIVEVPEYKDIFISGQDALLGCDNHSILIVVDTNRPDQVEYRPLLEAISKVCVVDHHRRAADYINPVVVNLHETYASSAAELVTELLLYAVEKDDVLPSRPRA